MNDYQFIYIVIKLNGWVGYSMNLGKTYCGKTIKDNQS